MCCVYLFTCLYWVFGRADLDLRCAGLLPCEPSAASVVWLCVWHGRGVDSLCSRKVIPRFLPLRTMELLKIHYRQGECLPVNTEIGNKSSCWFERRQSLETDLITKILTNRRIL